MQKQGPAASDPDAYVAGLAGWQLDCVTRLRAAVRAVAGLDEVIKWGHLVYLFDGPVLLIRAEPTRVLFGFWRGQRLREIEPRLAPGGRYEMATLALREGMELKPATARRLARAALALQRELGDPRLAAKAPAARTATSSKASKASTSAKAVKSPRPAKAAKAHKSATAAEVRKRSPKPRR